jgi:hypothetical protein
MENKRKYNSIFRQNLKDKISKLNSKSDYITIYKIITSDTENKVSINKNGVYFNINILSDDIIEKIYSFISEKIETETNTEQKIKYETYSKDNQTQMDIFFGPKLSNQDKTILKRLQQK